MQYNYQKATTVNNHKQEIKKSQYINGGDWQVNLLSLSPQNDNQDYTSTPNPE